MKAINLLTLKEIKAKFSIDEMLDLIAKYTAEAQKYKAAMRHAKSQMEFSANELFLDIANTKIKKLEALAY